jgi:hypothetical protein
MHGGMDIGHPGGRGTPVLNVQDGIVDRVVLDDTRRRGFGGYGNVVVVHHPADDTWALYGHLDSLNVTQGQQVSAGTRLGTMGNSSNGKFRGMGVHLHLELRRRRSNGRAPFPGPYPRSERQLFNNLDPRAWLEGKGLLFGRRGAFEVQPQSEMAQTRPAWEALGGYSAGQTTPWSVPESALGAKTASVAPAVEGEDYEPPARFDRDVRFGLTPVEWAAAGAGLLILTGTSVALVARSRMRPNRRRVRRRRTSR